MSVRFRRLLLWLLLLPVTGSPAFAAEQADYFSDDRLEQLVAPIALYPDALVAQVLMASTYPLQVAQAARWRQRHPGLKDGDLDRAAAAEPWDPSVKSLLHFPDVLKRMNENLDWTKDLGDAVLARQPAVMAAIQRMRRYAYDAGNLQSTEVQRVVVEDRVIRVEPATQVIYAPSYNPSVVYGSYWLPSTWYYPIFAYPVDYWYPIGYPAASIVSFGFGVLAGAVLWGHCDWHDGWIGYYDHHHHHGWHGDGDVYVDRSLTINNFNSPRGAPARWEHNPLNRRGVAYRDPETARHFDRVRSEMANRGPGAPARPGMLGGPGGPRTTPERPRGYDLLGRRGPVEGGAQAGPQGTPRAIPGDISRKGPAAIGDAGGSSSRPGEGAKGPARPSQRENPRSNRADVPSGRGNPPQLQRRGAPQSGDGLPSATPRSPVARSGAQPRSAPGSRGDARPGLSQGPSMPQGAARAPGAPNYRAADPSPRSFTPSQAPRGFSGSSGPMPRPGGFGGAPSGLSAPRSGGPGVPAGGGGRPR